MKDLDITIRFTIMLELPKGFRADPSWYTGPYIDLNTDTKNMLHAALCIAIQGDPDQDRFNLATAWLTDVISNINLTE